MRRLLVLLAGALLLSGCATGHSAVDVNNGGEFRFVAGTPAGTVIPVSKRATAPSFSGTLLDGAHFSSSSLHGKVAVINFWGSWCPPCRAETPDFQAVYSQEQGSGVAFLGINVKDDAQLAKAYLSDKHITYPSLFDPRGEVALAFRDYPANAIPSTIVLDRAGRVAAVYTSVVTKNDLLKVVDDVAKEG